MKSKNHKVCAVVVTYNPDEEVLDNLEAISKQVDYCIVVDNASEPAIKEKILSKIPTDRFHIIYNEKNQGIATAFNQGVWQCEKDYDWVITFDQDTHPYPSLVNQLLSFYENSNFKEKIGLLAPTHYDQKTGYQSSYFKNLKEDFLLQDYVFSSGSLIPTKMFKEVGYFNEDFFVDYVDHDFCLRLQSYGYRTVIVSKAAMAHNLGNIKKHKLFWFYYFSHNYSARRRYYMSRNRIFVYKSFSSWTSYWVLKDLLFFTKDLAKLILVEDQKIEKLKNIFIGTLDGITGRTGAFDDLYPTQQKQLSLLGILSNSVINLMGQVIPFAIGLITIPFLIKYLGHDRFSLLTIVWMILGYFTLFDLGLGRAIIKLIADKIGENKFSEIPPLFWSSLVIMALVSSLGSVLIFLCGPYLADSFLQINSDLRQEVHDSLIYLAFSIPLVTLTAGIRSILEAEHQFKTLNYFQAALGIFTYSAPLAILPMTQNLNHIVAVLLFGRFISFLVHVFYVFKKYPELTRFVLVSKKDVPLLISLGGWMTISNVISPIMVYFDRFFLSVMVPVAQVGFYTTPYEVVSRLLIIPSSLVRVLFPAFATTRVKDSSNLHDTYVKSLILTGFLMFFPCIILFTFSYLLLKMWLGYDFAEQSYHVLQILAVGIYFNSLAYIPYTLIQSSNRPDITAKIHLFELPFYLGFLYLFILKFGIIGAAMTWTLRVFFDMLLMIYFAKKSLLLTSQKTESYALSS